MPAPATSQRIGFVDYQLDNFHANTFLKLLRGPLRERGYVVAGATAVERERGAVWAREREVPWFASIDELEGAVDCLMVLAPSNPELHLELCEQAFALRKPTFVDKTFAPDLASARRIFELADRYGVAVQSSSALRYTAVQPLVESLPEPVRHLYVWAGGASLAEYLIHPVELAVSCLGSEATHVARWGCEAHPNFVLQFAADRSAMIDFTAGTDVPYVVAITTDSATQFLELDLANLFRDALAAILDFFDAGVPLVDRSETLAVRQLLDMAFRAGDPDSLADGGRSLVPPPRSAAFRGQRPTPVSGGGH